MESEGPALEGLLRRLAECPAEFLAEPRIGRSGQIEVAAVVSDLLRDLGGDPLSAKDAAVFAPQAVVRPTELRIIRSANSTCRFPR